MKTQNGMNKLAFNKAAVVELNDGQLNDVNGGSLSFFLSGVVVGLIIAIAID